MSNRYDQNERSISTSAARDSRTQPIGPGKIYKFSDHFGASGHKRGDIPVFLEMGRRFARMMMSWSMMENDVGSHNWNWKKNRMRTTTQPSHHQTADEQM